MFLCDSSYPVRPNHECTSTNIFRAVGCSRDSLAEAAGQSEALGNARGSCGNFLGSGCLQVRKF